MPDDGTKVIGAKLPANMRREVEAFQTEHDLSKSEALRALVREGLDSGRPAGKAEWFARTAVNLGLETAIVAIFIWLLAGLIAAYSVTVPPVMVAMLGVAATVLSVLLVGAGTAVHFLYVGGSIGAVLPWTDVHRTK